MPTSSTISFCPSFLYLRESRIFKFGVVFVISFFIESLQTLLNGLTRSMYNLYETASIIASYSTSRVKSIVLTVLGYYLVHMEVEAKLNVEYLEIDPTILQNPENLLKSD